MKSHPKSVQNCLTEKIQEQNMNTKKVCSTVVEKYNLIVLTLGSALTTSN